MNKYIKQGTDNFMMLSWIDEFLQGHEGYICGGCFKNIFNAEKIKDIDIFFPTKEDFYCAVDHFDHQSNGFEGNSKHDEKYQFYYQNERVKAYKHQKTNTVIELCCTIFGKPEEILNQFDFTITKFAYYIDRETQDGEEKQVYRVLYHNDFFEHLHLKRLVADENIPFPMATYDRMFRYAKYGYYPCRETKIKTAKAIHDLTIDAININQSLYDGWD